MKIYTRSGDGGETSLFGGGRVEKSHRRVEAYGAVDELNAALGVASAIDPVDFERALLEAIQADLFAIGSHLACRTPQKVAQALERATLDPRRVAEMERRIDEADRELPELEHFILPAGTLKAAALHLARTVCRRAERAVVRLHGDEPVSEEFLRYLNRLSDLLFVLARLANRRAEVPDRPW